MGSLSNDLAAVVGADSVLDPAPSFYRADATEAAGLEGTPDAVVVPATAEQVTAVVAWCYERDIAIVPRGGGSGFAGGAVPINGGVVIDLRRMTAFADEVVIPIIAAEVAAVVAWCYEHDIAIVPRGGGGSGFAGGAVPVAAAWWSTWREDARCAASIRCFGGSRSRPACRRQSYAGSHAKAACCFRPTPARRSSRRSAATSPPTLAARTHSSTASPGPG